MAGEAATDADLFAGRVEQLSADALRGETRVRYVGSCCSQAVAALQYQESATEVDALIEQALAAFAVSGPT